MGEKHSARRVSSGGSVSGTDGMLGKTPSPETVWKFKSPNLGRERQRRAVSKAEGQVCGMRRKRGMAPTAWVRSVFSTHRVSVEGRWEDTSDTDGDACTWRLSCKGCTPTKIAHWLTRLTRKARADLGATTRVRTCYTGARRGYALANGPPRGGRQKTEASIDDARASCAFASASCLERRGHAVQAAEGVSVPAPGARVIIAVPDDTWMRRGAEQSMITRRRRRIQPARYRDVTRRRENVRLGGGHAGRQEGRYKARARVHRTRTHNSIRYVYRCGRRNAQRKTCLARVRTSGEYFVFYK
ncbi:hypothetical protein C2E23DRAFT_938520 [Lenzites betulinus]|nr:hypothetical protein C2E23DRAFT_938520 [Lenzites betulinus]